MLGIAALVAIGSFRRSLAEAIDEQARTLLGADLVVSSSRPFAREEEQLLDSLGKSQAREVRFTTMAYFPSSGGTRLVSLRALGGEFPFYGTMDTAPASAARDFRAGLRAVVDESLLFQFRVRAGDRIKIGDLDFTIAGALKKIPGDASAGASFAPRVYVPLQNLEGTHLIKPGSVVRYRAYVKFPASVDPAERIAAVSPRIGNLGLQFDTVEKRKKDLGEALENLYRFLNLVAFISLLLGAVGVASAIQAHLRQKISTAAILRCLGSSARTTVLIYLLQAAAMGLAGAVAGAGLGLAIQASLPRVLQSFLPLAIPTTIFWQPILRGMLIGFAVCILFALPPLVKFRRVSPLLVLRASVENEKWEGPQRPDRRGAKAAPTLFDPVIWLLYALIAAGVAAFAISQAETWKRGLLFAIALGVAIAIFAGVAKLIMVGVRKWFPHRASFVVREGLANLYRPDNRTLLLTLALGLGTFLLLSLYLTREVLLTQFRSIDRDNRPNIFLFDIQSDQKEAVEALVREQRFPIIQEAPIVTMRLIEVMGRKSSDILADPQHKIPDWELEREYRSTYREQLSETEKITDGSWISRIDYHPGDVVPISLDREIAKDLGAKIGDQLVFDVQGVPIKTRIASLREVDWKRFQTNFFVVFPAGVLENAPGFHVIVSRVATPADSARLQNAVVGRFPNVAALDLSSVIQTVEGILNKVALVIRIISFFTVGAGLIVLASTIWSGRFQRLKESVLLRTLGASRAQIRKILCAEYFFLGLFASATGILLAILSSWALAKFVFKLDYVASVPPLLIAAIAVPALTVLIGLGANRGVGSAPPLAVLRDAVEW
jgi:putative ABC transport system permease protein